MSKTTKITIWLIVAIIIIAGIWWGVSKKLGQIPTTEKETIKIGAILPLSGGAAAYGEQIKNGIDLALRKISESNESKVKINVIYEDSKCDPKESISAYNKLVDTDGVKIIIGTFCSSATLSITPLAERDHVILITPGAASARISDEGDYIFRNHITMKQKTGYLAKMASAKFKKAAIIYNGANDVFVESASIFRNVFISVNDNKVVSIESFKTGDIDFRTQLLKIKSKDPEVIYIGSIMPELALIVKQIRELDIDAQILTDDGVLDPNFLKVTRNLSEGIIFGTTKFSKESAPDFWNTYYNLFKENPTIFSAQGYDTLNILYSIISNKCSTGDTLCIKDQLYKIKDYQGVSGKTSFDEKGDAIKEVVLKTIKNGKFVPFKD